MEKVENVENEKELKESKVDEKKETNNQGKKKNEKIGFFWILLNQIGSYAWPTLISLIIIALLNVLLIVPEKIDNELSEALNTKDKDKITIAK